MITITKGEWEVFVLNNRIVGVCSSGADIAHCTDDDGGKFDSTRPLGQDIANAYLIAASPHLKKAAVDMIAAFNMKGGGRSTAMHQAVAELQAAVAKSEVPAQPTG